MPGNGIFISYRRDDTSGYAGRLYDRLVGRFGDDRVFMDIDTIAPGHEFATDIEKALIDCDACVVLIGRRWLSITDAEGHRRLDDPIDFVRLEVATAIRRGVTIFPVLVDRANAPASASLPDDIRPLAGRQAIELTNERWNYDTGRLLLALQEELAPTEPPRQPVQPKRERPPRSPKRPALIAGGALLALVVAIGAWLATRSNGEVPTGGGQSTVPGAASLSGTYAVTMELTRFKGTLGEDNQLWNEPNPVVGRNGDEWDSQTWIFPGNGSWKVAERDVINGALEPDGSYTDMGNAKCSSEPDGSADVTRHLVPTTESPGPAADSFTGELTIHWNCEATGPIDATFAVSGTSSASSSLSDYTANVDGLLQQSGRAVKGLNSGLKAALHTTSTTSELVSARATVRAVIASRETMLTQASSWEVPAGAEDVNRRLVEALSVSLQQDRDWLRYINAKLTGDSTTANAVYASIKQSPTDSVKASFLDAYNQLREQSGERPLPSDYLF